MAEPNPLLETWDTPFGLPPFDRILPAHFRPAFEAAMAEARAEIETIAANPAPPDFDNVVGAMERSGARLGDVAMTFYALAGGGSDDAIQEIERWVAPELARHRADMLMNAALFARLEAVRASAASAASSLTAEQARVLALYIEMFERAGARLEGPARARMSAIMQRLATLGAEFSQRVLADERDWELALDDDADLAGLPEQLREAMASAASDRGKTGHVVTLSRSLIEPFLVFSERRDLREAAWRAWTSRGIMRDETSTRAIAAETIALRDERARLLGFANFASYKLANQMAGVPEAVDALLRRVWAPARDRAMEERAGLGRIAAEEGANIEIEAWDWRHYAEKLRRADHDFDESEVKPYLSLDNMIAAAFDVAHRLFGLTFREIEDAPRLHPDARIWEVTGRDGAHLGVFIGDYFARSTKRSGAWMSGLRDQMKLDGETRPIITNTMNFAKAPAGRPTLLTHDDARTLFHEFGHALHGLLSDVTYPFISGTSVARDFVELPSQLFEHWLGRPEVLTRFARHVETGEPMPDALIEKLRGAETFGQGFATVEYTACALVDLDLHLGGEAAKADPFARAEAVLAEIGMPREIAMRHATPHFSHVFAGDGYSAGYYSYMWSEVMDADAFDAFEEAGDVFDPAIAERLLTHVYSAGASRDPADLYIAFRGRGPSEDALLRRRGLAA